MREITSRKNPELQHLKRLGADRAYRDACGEFLCDGVKLYREALAWGAEVTAVAVADRDLAGEAEGNVLLVPRDVLAAISPMKTPQPILFSCRRREVTLPENPRRVVVLEGVQDPGNVGTVLRSANAFFADAVLLTGDCADLYNPKTVRAAMGALFRQCVAEVTPDELVDYVNQTGLTLLGAALEEGGVSAGGDLPERAAVAVGSEGRGLSRELLARCSGTVRIPMNPACESLNAGVAASILLWELFRRGGTPDG